MQWMESLQRQVQCTKRSLPLECLLVLGWCTLHVHQHFDQML